MEITRKNIRNPKKDFSDLRKIYNGYNGYFVTVENIGKHEYKMFVYECNKMSKYDLCQYFDELTKNVYSDNVLRNKLFNLIVKNGWLDYYITNFPNEFGI